MHGSRVQYFIDRLAPSPGAAGGKGNRTADNLSSVPSFAASTAKMTGKVTQWTSCPLRPLPRRRPPRLVRTSGLADFFGVDTRTIYRWKNTHEDFCQSLIAGKENADARVERALFNCSYGPVRAKTTICRLSLRRRRRLREKTRERFSVTPSGVPKACNYRIYLNPATISFHAINPTQTKRSGLIRAIKWPTCPLDLSPTG